MLRPDGPMAPTPEYQSLGFTNHTKSCPTYWHHILIFTQVLSSLISIWRHHRGHFTIYKVNSHLHSEFSLSQNTSVCSEISCPTQSATRPPTPVRPAETSVAPRQSEGFLGTRDCLRHHIDPRATMTTRLLMTFIQVTRLYDVNL